MVGTYLLIKIISIMVNKIILVGHVGRDPEVRRMENNLVCARFSLATSERWNKDGNKTEHTEWHNVVLWRTMAEVAEKYVRKGTLLYIEGKIRSNSYEDKDGIKRYSTNIVGETMNILTPKSNGNQNQQIIPPEPPSAPIELVPPEDLPF